MSESLFASCAEALSLCQSLKDDLASVLDPKTGFAPRLRQICRDRLADLEDLTDVSREEVEALRMESDTWGLLQAVMPARKTEQAPLASARSLLAENPYTPTSNLAQAIMNSSFLLSELVVVREWLHEIAPEAQHPEASTGYWKFTKHRLMQALRTGNEKDADGLVMHMDPDAGSREEGRNLAGDDTNYEKLLARTLYTYLRRGRLEDAFDLCKRAHQPWRSASIRGSLIFQWTAIANEVPDIDAMDDEDVEGWRGNKRRKLWKSTCTRAALNPHLSDEERVLYASLAPSPQTSVILKSACRTWEDHLWAQISIMCEEKQSAELLKLGGGFWEEEGLGAEPSGEDMEEDGEWEKEVHGTLESLATVRVEEGPPADHAYHISQLHIILDRTDDLLDDFANGLRGGQYDPASRDYPAMTRFFAHLCLFLQMIDVPVPALATQVILEAYLQVLELAGQRELIAMYAGALGDNAVERYAMFLASLELSADVNERQLALRRAEEHGLDLNRVAIATAERTIEKAFEILPPLKGPLPSGDALLPPPNDVELLLLRSIEWTTFTEDTYDTALEQADVIVRYFLGAGKVLMAKALLDMLPLELASISEPEELATEYLHYRQFFSVWDLFDRVGECQALESQHMSKETEMEWSKDYKGLIDETREQVVKLLTSDWLVSDVENVGGDRRRRELIAIRQTYIPDFIIRLHVILFNSRTRFPENLKHALELANIVADSRYKVYDDFTDEDGRRLGDYLGAVRQAILAGLEGGGSDPFRIVSS